jgi:hypothetical protein
LCRCCDSLADGFHSGTWPWSAHVSAQSKRSSQSPCVHVGVNMALLRSSRVHQVLSSSSISAVFSARGSSNRLFCSDRNLYSVLSLCHFDCCFCLHSDLSLLGSEQPWNMPQSNGGVVSDTSTPIPVELHLFTYCDRFTNASMNIVTDIAVAVIPLPIIKSMNLPKPQRIALGVVFGLGSL